MLISGRRLKSERIWKKYDFYVHFYLISLEQMYEPYGSRFINNVNCGSFQIGSSSLTLKGFQCLGSLVTYNEFDKGRENS